MNLKEFIIVRCFNFALEASHGRIYRPSWYLLFMRVEKFKQNTRRFHYFRITVGFACKYYTEGLRDLMCKQTRHSHARFVFLRFDNSNSKNIYYYYVAQTCTSDSR